MVTSEIKTIISITHETGVAHVEFKSGKQSEFKKISVDDLITCFLDTKKLDTEDKVKTPLLPPGTIGYTEKTANNYLVYMISPAIIHSYNFQDIEYQDIPFPKCIYRLGVKNNRLSNVYVWSIQFKEKILKPSTPIYHYPYYHVFKDGRVCFGDNFFDVNSPWELHRAPYYHQNLPAVGHGGGFHNAKIAEGEPLAGHSLLKTLSEQKLEVFPDEWLMPAGIMLQDILNS